MATVECDGKKKEVRDGDKIKKPCEEFGVLFGCEGGFCGMCCVEILEGKENLSGITGSEKSMGIKENGKERLACQCSIKKGRIKIKPRFRRNA